MTAKSIAIALSAAPSLLLPSTAMAQQVQAHLYDVHGRLVSVTRSNGGASQTTTYALDHAGNRTSRVIVGPPVASRDPGAPASRQERAALDVEGPRRPRATGPQQASATPTGTQ